ncbi:MAG: DNA polymerase/3'-5' exonuclease PolX [Deltaproteobacteria bacterium]|nr:DNA polymerase/3'-5' exonuclease PolX [Deltaproteobacteria bacterium]
MPVYNMDIAAIFNKLADLLEIQGANPFRVRAYRNAARTVESLPKSVSDMIDRGEKLTDLPGVGKDLAGKMEEIVRTGALKALEEEQAKLPRGIEKLLDIEDLGPKRVAALHKELGIKNLEDLKKALDQGKVRELSGFGEKSEQKIRQHLTGMAGGEKRVQLFVAEQVAKTFVDYLRGVEGVRKVALAGSFRRRKETVGDLDVLVACDDGAPVMDKVVEYDEVVRVAAKGSTKTSVVLRTGLRVDVRLLPVESWGAALHYFTGSKAHNIEIRGMGVKKGLKINEYGVFKGEKRVGGAEEKDVYDAVGLPFIEPELRENRGEIEAAKKGTLPKLITLSDIQGDLHAHTNVTDGKNTMEEMAAAAKALGYSYLGITNHSKRVSMAKGLDEAALAKEVDKIRKFNDTLSGFRVLAGLEVDILEDGSLDLSNEALDDLDFTVCSVHYNRRMSAEQMTKRILKAMDNPRMSILGHPTGRLINEREGYAVDLEKVIAGAVERGCVVELNAYPDRLDIDDVHCKLAKELGALVAINTDAHSTGDLSFMRFGIGQARRGWLEAADVVNTKKTRELLRALER